MPTSIRASYARLAMTCAAVVDIRYYLQGVFVDPRPEGGAYIVATDGHCLMAIIDESAECSEATILAPNRQTIAVCPKVGDLKRDTATARLRLSEFEGKPALAVTNENGIGIHVQISFPVLEGKFPNWRKVLPAFADLKPGYANSLNATYPTRFVGAIAQGTYAISAAPYQAKPDGPVVFRIDRRDNVLFVVMPLREGSSFDSWASVWKPLELAAKVELEPALA